MRHSSRYKLLYLIIILIILTSGCGRSSPEPTTPAVDTAEPAETEETAAPVETATPTATPEPATIILLQPQGADPEIADEMKALLETAAAEGGYRFQTAASLSASELTPAVKVVAALPPATVGELAAGATDVHFLAIGYNDLQPAANLSVVATQATTPDMQGFLAGYLAAVISSDWRVGVISIGDTTEGVDARQGFLNGAEYFCGLCRNVYPPYRDVNGNILEYPSYSELPSNATSTEWAASAQAIIDRAVEVVYVVPGAGDQAMLESLAAAGIKIIGGNPPPETVGQSWAATIQVDLVPAVEKLLEAALQGMDGSLENAGLAISNINPDWISEGKLRLVEQLLGEIEAGYIKTIIK